MTTLPQAGRSAADNNQQPGNGAPPKPKRHRAGKGGGKLHLKTLETLDQRTLAAKKSRQHIASLEADQLFEAKRQLMQDDAFLSAMIEADATVWLAGGIIVRNEFLATVNARRRTLLALVALGMDHRGSGGPTLDLDLDDIEREIANEEVAAED